MGWLILTLFLTVAAMVGLGFGIEKVQKLMMNIKNSVILLTIAQICLVVFNMWQYLELKK